jgi:hypothetical protein
VFRLLGYTDNPQVKIKDFKLNIHKINRGEDLNFDFNLTSHSNRNQKIVVDFAIHFVKKNGKTTAKVFKLKSFTIEAKADVDLFKKHSFKEISTRKYYIGTHKIEILVNGQTKATKHFDLI